MVRTTPRLVLHSHWHHRYRYDLLLPAGEVGDTPTRMVVHIEGLPDDGTGDGRAWGILELPSLVFTAGTELEPT